MEEGIKYCNTYDAAKTLNVTRATILNMVKDGRLVGKKFSEKENSQVFIDKESLNAWL